MALPSMMEAEEEGASAGKEGDFQKKKEEVEEKKLINWQSAPRSLPFLLANVAPS